MLQPSIISLSQHANMMLSYVAKMLDSNSLPNTKCHKANDSREREDESW